MKRSVSRQMYIANVALYVLTAIHVSFGVCIIVVGGWLVSKYTASDLRQVPAWFSDVKTSASVLLTGGIFVIVYAIVVLFVPFGRLKEKERKLFFHVHILIACLGLIGFFFTAAMLEWSAFREKLPKQMNATVLEYYGQPGYENQTAMWDHHQRKMGCCGANGYEDWLRSKWYKEQPQGRKQSVPDSCCVLSNPHEFDEPPDPVNATLCYELKDQYVYKQGCRFLARKSLPDAAYIVWPMFGIEFILMTATLVAWVIFWDRYLKFPPFAKKTEDRQNIVST